MEFTPSVYAHAAALIGKSPRKVSRDPELLFSAHAAAYRRYGHRPVVVGIDIYNLEAEAYGAVVDRPQGNGIPSITDVLCSTLDDVRRLNPYDPLTAGQKLGVAFFESGATPPLLSPDLFSEVELPVLTDIVRQVSRMAGQSVPCVIGGDTAPILEALLKTGTTYVICPHETDQARFMRTMRQHPDVMVRVNTDMRVYTSHDRAAMVRELDRVLALALPRERVCIGTGTLPYETAPDMVLQAGDYLASITGA